MAVLRNTADDASSLAKGGQSLRWPDIGIAIHGLHRNGERAIAMGRQGTGFRSVFPRGERGQEGVIMGNAPGTMLSGSAYRMPGDMRHPLASHVDFSSSDLERVRAYLSRAYSPHAMYVSCPGELAVSHARIDLGLLTLGCLSFCAEVLVQPSFTPHFIVHIPLEGALQVRRNGALEEVHAGQAAITCPKDRVEVLYGRGSRTLLVKFAPHVLEDVFQQLVGSRPSGKIQFRRPIDARSSLIEAAWLRQLMFVVNEISDHAGGLDAVRLWGRDMEASLLGGLLYAADHTQSDVICRGDSEPLPWYIKHAERYMRDHADEDLRILDIVASVGVSERTLYNGFKRYRGMSPMNYLLMIRLDNVRNDIERADQHDSITSIASCRGFGHLGRFSKLFRERFGILPSELLRQRRMPVTSRSSSSTAG